MKIVFSFCFPHISGENQFKETCNVSQRSAKLNNEFQTPQPAARITLKFNTKSNENGEIPSCYKDRRSAETKQLQDIIKQRVATDTKSKFNIPIDVYIVGWSVMTDPIVGSLMVCMNILKSSNELWSSEELKLLKSTTEKAVEGIRPKGLFLEGVKLKKSEVKSVGDVSYTLKVTTTNPMAGETILYNIPDMKGSVIAGNISGESLNNNN